MSVLVVLSLVSICRDVFLELLYPLCLMHLKSSTAELGPFTVCDVLKLSLELRILSGSFLLILTYLLPVLGHCLLTYFKHSTLKCQLLEH